MTFISLEEFEKALVYGPLEWTFMVKTTLNSWSVCDGVNCFETEKTVNKAPKVVYKEKKKLKIFKAKIDSNVQLSMLF